MTTAERTVAELESRLDTLLPEEYQGAFDDVQPTPMGSAGLRFDADGRVAWDEMWGSFCDLAIAGGPPHKGRLLQPGDAAEIEAAPERFNEVVQEIRRGVRLVTDLEGSLGPDAGWIRFRCFNETMAGWLLRAITMENVAVRANGNALDMPAAPSFRLEREIKNVITVMAKTCHYWLGHMPRDQHRAISELFAVMANEAPLLVPGGAGPDVDRFRAGLADTIPSTTGLRMAGVPYAGWIGVDVASVRGAIWMMRAMVASNILARREETVLYVPVNPAQDPFARRIVRTLKQLHDLAKVTGVLRAEA